MSGRPTRTTTDDRGFGRYLTEAAIESSGHVDRDQDEGSEERPAEQPDNVDTSRPPTTGKRGQRGTGFGRYLA